MIPAPDADTPLPVNIEWLRERFERSGLAAIDVPPDIPDTSVRAIGRRLLRNYVFNRSASRFEELWPEPIEAVTLRPRVFDGRFDGGDAPGGAGGGDGIGPGRAGGGGTGSGGGTGDGEGPGTSSEEATGDAGYECPLGDEAWHWTRDRVTEEYAGIAHDAGDEICKHFLERVVEALPREMKEDEELGKEAVQRLLEKAALNPLPTEAALGAMLVNIHQDLDGGGSAGRGNHRDGWIEPPDEDEGEGQQPKERKQGHKGDDQVVDDRTAFDEELARLPSGRTRPFTRAEAEVKAEQLDVLLHYVLATTDPAMQARLVSLATPVLGDLGPDELHLLGSVLKRFWFRADGSAGGARTRLLNLLTNAGHAHLLRDVGVFTVDYLVESFPRDFLLYVQCLDVTNAADRSEAATVCRRLTPHQVAGAGDVLRAQGALARRAVRDQLLGIADPSVRPLAQLVFEADPEGSRASIIRFLAATHGPLSIARTLAVLEPGPWLPNQLLRRLLATEPGSDQQDVSLRDDVARVVIAKLESLSDAMPDHPTRIAFVEALGHLPADRSVSYLRRLRRARKWLLFPAEPKAVRDAAARAMAMLRGRFGHV